MAEGTHQTMLRSVVADRPWIVAMDVLVSAAAVAKQLKELGASRCLAIGASRGTGRLPQGVDMIGLGLGGTSMMDAIRVAEVGLDDLPDHARATVDAFDPDGEARVIRPFYSAGRPVGGRRTYGVRDLRWRALEDKTVIDALWDAVGVPRAPSRIVSSRREDLDVASAAIDAGDGVVWAGDNRSGWHGGGVYTRWVKTTAQADAAHRHLSAECDEIRVMPLLEGIPCSIHGMVFPEQVIALRPCEMLVLRRPDGSFFYVAAATLWDPPPSDREEMRALARQVGRHLRQQLGYRGVFTIDGVMTAAGFRPTELNPRFGAGINLMTQGMAELPLMLLNFALIEGEDLDWQPEALEAHILDHADTNRRFRLGAMVHDPIDASVSVRLGVGTDDTLWPLGDGEEAEETIELFADPVSSGCYINARMHTPALARSGRSAAPLAAALLREADQRWGLGIGPLMVSPDRR
jgi:hypothetical protein